MPKARAPSFAQLCAIARDEIDADPTIDDSEWRERIKCTLARRQLVQPQPHVIADAMDRAERALTKQRGPRPAPLPPTPEPAPSDGLRPLTDDEARAALARVFAELRQRGTLPPTSPLRAMPSPEPETMTTRERYHTVVQIEQLRELHRQQRARAATPKEIAGAGS